MASDNGVVISRDTPHHLRVYMGEGDRLPGKPSRQQLHMACTVGARVGGKRKGPRVKCKSRVGPLHKRWTTVEAWNEYDAIINGEIE